MAEGAFTRNEIQPVILIDKQDRIPVGCIPPAWKPYAFQFQLPSLDVTRGVGDRMGPQMNKFQQVSSDTSKG